MARDYYAEANALAAKLAEQGHGLWAQQLIDAMAAGATATEILMGLRWVLARLLRHQGELPTDLGEEAERLHRGLDRLLGFPGPRTGKA